MVWPIRVLNDLYTELIYSLFALIQGNYTVCLVGNKIFVHTDDVIHELENKYGGIFGVHCGLLAISIIFKQFVVDVARKTGEIYINTHTKSDINSTEYSWFSRAFARYADGIYCNADGRKYDTAQDGILTHLYINTNFVATVFRNNYGELVITDRKIKGYDRLGEHLIVKYNKGYYLVLMTCSRLCEFLM